MEKTFDVTPNICGVDTSPTTVHEACFEGDWRMGYAGSEEATHSRW
jgi:hypothetical protein